MTDRPKPSTLRAVTHEAPEVVHPALAKRLVRKVDEMAKTLVDIQDEQRTQRELLEAMMDLLRGTL